MDYTHKLYQHSSYYHHLYCSTFKLKNIEKCAIICLVRWNYGNILLKKITEYLLNNNKLIRLDINKNNINSIKCALKNNYEEDKKIEDIVRYRRH